MCSCAWFADTHSCAHGTHQSKFAISISKSHDPVCIDIFQSKWCCYISLHLFCIFQTRMHVHFLQRTSLKLTLHCSRQSKTCTVPVISLYKVQKNKFPTPSVQCVPTLLWKNTFCNFDYNALGRDQGQLRDLRINSRVIDPYKVQLHRAPDLQHRMMWHYFKKRTFLECSPFLGWNLHCLLKSSIKHDESIGTQDMWTWVTYKHTTVDESFHVGYVVHTEQCNPTSLYHVTRKAACLEMVPGRADESWFSNAFCIMHSCLLWITQGGICNALTKYL